ncbi:hypothetical protein [Actinomycetospora lemnae]|uniref:Uncharacterized protein n=1 Tax=Actinomycetospora lemnae TaxID=3019891 RepID=A0ABT5SM85_9PSEU|nr:hypothetical protein [Actinomycetospora sp. DW7H6]MDD7963940.1 hypothetical protein [Actinomycetospora sp. DW7H6]
MITNRDLDVIGLPSLPAPASPRDEDAAVFELVREAPPYRDGWVLLCRRGGRVTWSMPLAPRGAAPRVRPAVAQAVAVRVLDEQGVFVSGWNQVGPADPGDDTPHFVARRPLGTTALPV